MHDSCGQNHCLLKHIASGVRVFHKFAIFVKV